jgi:hypothetical protein
MVVDPDDFNPDPDPSKQRTVLNANFFNSKLKVEVTF